MFLLVVYLLIALGFSFLCSIAEAVLLSVTPSFIAQLQEGGSSGGKLLTELKRDVDRPLAAILSLNTIAHTVGAAGVGAQAYAVFEGRFVGLTSAILTILILVFSEIIPKTIGARYWRGLAVPTAHFCRFLIVSLYPLVWLSQQITRVISPEGGHPTMTRDEFAALARASAQSGSLAAKESRILANLFRLESLTVRDIMTPRTVMFSLPAETQVRELESASLPQFSRIPIHGATRDELLGFVLKTDILLAHAQDRFDVHLKELKRDIPAVPEAATLSKLFELLMDKRAHIAVVVDEYGGVRGLVTLEDLVETLLGLEIIDEADRTVDMQALARARWAKRAKALGIEIPEQVAVAEHGHGPGETAGKTESNPARGR